jgi:hypothetical protein
MRKFSVYVDQHPGIFPYITPSTAGDEVRVGAHIPSYHFDREVASFTCDRGSILTPIVDMRKSAMFKHGKITSTQCYDHRKD